MPSASWRAWRAALHARSAVTSLTLEFRDSLQRLAPQCRGVAGDADFTRALEPGHTPVERGYELVQVFDHLFGCQIGRRLANDDHWVLDANQIMSPAKFIVTA